MGESDFLKVLRSLHHAGVEFIVVGGLAAVLNGAPVDTFDVDIVPARQEENLTRLLSVLERMDAIFRIQPSRRFKPDMSHLRSSGHKNLTPRYGVLDVLGTIGRGLGYQELLPHTVAMEIAGGLNVRVLDLPAIIQLKEELRGEKDLAVLPVLRRTWEEKQKLHRQ